MPWREAYRMEIDGTGAAVSVSLLGDPAPGDVADYLEWVVAAMRKRQAKVDGVAQEAEGHDQG